VGFEKGCIINWFSTHNFFDFNTMSHSAIISNNSLFCVALFFIPANAGIPAKSYLSPKRFLPSQE
jgi:uncharacterized membrane protein YphA (DoxX/SURF4 family)